MRTKLPLIASKLDESKVMLGGFGAGGAGGADWALAPAPWTTPAAPGPEPEPILLETGTLKSPCLIAGGLGSLIGSGFLSSGLSFELKGFQDMFVSLG